MRTTANYYGKVRAEVTWGAESRQADREYVVFDPTGKGEIEIEITPWLMKDLMRQFRKALKVVDPKGTA